MKIGRAVICHGRGGAPVCPIERGKHQHGAIVYGAAWIVVNPNRVAVRPGGGDAGIRKRENIGLQGGERGVLETLGPRSSWPATAARLGNHKSLAATGKVISRIGLGIDRPGRGWAAQN